MIPSRRQFLQATGLGCGALAWGGLIPSAVAAIPSARSLGAADLPAGAAPKPVPLRHFPSPLHAFVWRNWELMPLPRMAAVVGAKPADLRALGRRMGLSGPPRVPADQQRRSAITVIRRNWHLLPYEQLLALLGWTPEQMAFALREDDFLFVKLGNLKPQCPPIRYTPSGAAIRQREREIAGWLQEVWPAHRDEPEEPLFEFVRTLSASPPKPAAHPDAPSVFAPRFCYSYFALYGDPLLEREADPYPDGLLARLAEAGVDGVWLQAVLYKLARFPWDPALSDRYEERLRRLRDLVARARRHGVGVWLYLNEPRAMPLAFHQAHPGLQGVVEGDHATLCTSVPEVSAYLQEAVASVCRAVPDLAGFFTITASENLTNCWSHHAGKGCPRCAQRPPADVIAGVNRILRAGIRDADSRAALVAWDWGWADDWAGAAVAQLPHDVALMSVSEWSIPIERGGVRTTVGEYSISTVGPGPRAKRQWAAARQRGLRVLAKIQAGNTWELSSVPYIPAVRNVAQHAANLVAEGVNGLMLGWTLGGYPSPNLEVVTAIATAAAGGSRPAPETALRRVAERRFGARLAPAVVAAWDAFSAAFSEFPYDGGLVYNAPMQYGPANLLWGEPTGYRATMVGFPYDDLDGWRTAYPPEVFIQQFTKVADGFDQALATLRGEVEAAHAALTKTQRTAITGELRVAEAAALHFRSAAHQARFVVLRRLLGSTPTATTAEPMLTELEAILRAELRLAVRLYTLQRADSRLGFEASNQYFYVPLDLAEKVLNCRDLLERWLPARRQQFQARAASSVGVGPREVVLRERWRR